MELKKNEMNFLDFFFFFLWKNLNLCVSLQQKLRGKKEMVKVSFTLLKLIIFSSRGKEKIREN